MSDENSDVDKSAEERDEVAIVNLFNELVVESDLSESNTSVTTLDGSATSMENNTTMSMEKFTSSKLYDEAVAGAFTNRHELVSKERRLCLETKCICEKCYNHLLNDYESPVLYFTKTTLQNCSICSRKTQMKTYQQICYECSRCKNTCFVCVSEPVVDKMDFFHFDALITGPNEVIFNNLPESHQRSIIRSVYRAYDLYDDRFARFDNGVQTFQSLIQRKKPKI